MRSDRRWFLLLLLTFGYFYQGGFANSNARFDLALSIALGHRYDISALSDNTIDKVTAHGLTFSEKAPGSAYAALSVPLIASAFAGLESIRRHPALADFLLHLSTVASVGLLSAAAAVAFRRLLSQLARTRSVESCWLITASVFLGTPLFVYSTMLFGHALAAAWLVIGLYAGVRAARARPGEAGITAHAAAAGVALGLAVLTEYPAVVPALAIASGVLLVARRPARLLPAIPGGLVAVALLMLHQAASFGSPFAIGYGRLAGTQFGSGMSRGFFGIVGPARVPALQLLFGTYRGLYVYAPVLVVASLGFWFWPRRLRRRLALPLVAGAAALWLLIAGYAYWQGGPAFGPRHLIPAIPLVGLGLAFWPRGRPWSQILAGASAVSILVNLVGTATTPFVSEFVSDPIVSVYPRLAAEGAMSINPVAFLTPATQVDARWAQLNRYPLSAYNLGERLGLTGWASLLPLLCVWGAALGTGRGPGRTRAAPSG